MGRSVIETDEGMRRDVRMPRERWRRPRAIIMALGGIVLLTLLIVILLKLLGSDWLAQQSEQARWLLNEMRTLRPRLHP